jgi:hypothetical protein
MPEAKRFHYARSIQISRSFTGGDENAHLPTSLQNSQRMAPRHIEPRVMSFVVGRRHALPF